MCKEVSGYAKITALGKARIRSTATPLSYARVQGQPRAADESTK